jgi:ubiquinone/menaquinone biosynthesis C-methylase UbiE
MIQSEYIETIKHRYGENNPLDDPVELYQQTMIEKGLVTILSRNKIRLSDAKQILDVDCGSGYWLRRLTELRGSASGLVDIDLSETMSVHAGKINGDMCSLPFADYSFNIITAFAFLCFLLEDKALTQAFKEVYRMLKPRGYSIFYDLMDKKRQRKQTRGFKEQDVRTNATMAGFTCSDRQYLFKRLLWIDESTTAYFGNIIPSEILSLTERLFFFSSSSKILLFQK